MLLWDEGLCEEYEEGISNFRFRDVVWSLLAESKRFFLYENFFIAEE